jgi:hypothetical protein
VSWLFLHRLGSPPALVVGLGLLPGLVTVAGIVVAGAVLAEGRVEGTPDAEGCPDGAELAAGDVADGVPVALVPPADDAAELWDVQAASVAAAPSASTAAVVRVMYLSLQRRQDVPGRTPGLSVRRRSCTVGCPTGCAGGAAYGWMLVTT